MKKKENKKLEEPRSIITGSRDKQISLKPAGKQQKSMEHGSSISDRMSPVISERFR
jgi:hypothetical protein